MQIIERGFTLIKTSLVNLPRFIGDKIRFLPRSFYLISEYPLNLRESALLFFFLI